MCQPARLVYLLLFQLLLFILLFITTTNLYIIRIVISVFITIAVAKGGTEASKKMTILGKQAFSMKSVTSNSLKNVNIKEKSLHVTIFP